MINNNNRICVLLIRRLVCIRLIRVRIVRVRMLHLLIMIRIILRLHIVRIRVFLLSLLFRTNIVFYVSSCFQLLFFVFCIAVLLVRVCSSCVLMLLV